MEERRRGRFANDRRKEGRRRRGWDKRAKHGDVGKGKKILVPTNGSNHFSFLPFPFPFSSTTMREIKQNEVKKRERQFTIGVDNLLCAETLVGSGGGIGHDREVDIACGGVDRDFAILEESDE